MMAPCAGNRAPPQPQRCGENVDDTTAAAATAKRTLRAELRKARTALPAEQRATASRAVQQLLTELPEVSAGGVLAYAATPLEVDIDPWLREVLNAGRALYLPWVEGADFGFARVRDLEDDVVPGWRGIREPRAALRRGVPHPDALSCAVVPGLGFDRRGGRLGHGGGHLDRLLSRLRPGVPTVGVAFGVQLVGAVPMEPHDVRVDVVVTEQGVARHGSG